MKKLFVLGLVLIGMIGLVACSSGVTKGEGTSKDGEKIYRIGILQIAEHPALDDNRIGFIERMAEHGILAEFDYQNAQGNVNNALSMAQKFVDDKVDLIFAIATPSAQAVKQAVSGSDIPVVFSAVTDPVSAELVETMDKPSGNLTGTSDMAPIEKQLKLFTDLRPEVKKVGIIYNTGETNSEVQVEMAKEIGKQIGMEIVTVGINNINELSQAVDSILEKVDGIYTITDNIVASGISIVAQKATAAGKITIGAEKAHVEGGVLMTEGISYSALGRQSADMAKKIIDGAKAGELPVENLEKTEKLFHPETAKILGLQNSKALEDAKAISGTEAEK